MTEPRVLLVEQLAGHSERIVRELMAAVAEPRTEGLVEGDPCLALPYPSPTEEGARGFLEAVLAWLSDDASAPLVTWLRTDDRSGLLGYVSCLRWMLPALAAATDVDVDGAEAHAWVALRMGRLARDLSALADVHLTRGHECTALMALYLETLHKLGSPLSVVTLETDFASTVLESGNAEDARRHFDAVIAACESVTEMRRELSERTPVWAHALRHLYELTEEAPA
jgi:hypothetical protein